MTKSGAPELVAAALTPLTAELAPHGGQLAAYCRWLVHRGCTAVLVMGSTGEANSFSVQERMEALEELLANGADPGTLIVGTGCCAVPDTVALTRHALSLGVSRALMLPPFYYKGVGDDGLFAAFDQVIQRVGDDRLRIYLYNFPGMTGVPFTDGLVRRLLTRYPVTVAGMKDSSGDIAAMLRTTRSFPGFRVFSGTERYLLKILEAGGAGCMTATLNVTSPFARTLARKANSEAAVRLQAELTGLRASIEIHPMVAALKYLVSRMQQRPSWLRMRPPLGPLERLAAARLDALVNRLKDP